MEKIIQFPSQQNVNESGERNTKQTIAERLGVTYIQVGDCLLPDIALNHEKICMELGVDPEDELGKYGELHKQYLKEHKPALYGQLLSSERLYPICLEVDKAASERLRLAEAHGIPSHLAEEHILAELVYTD